jgi:hypothetical protein
MDLQPSALRFYGSPTDVPPLDLATVEAQLDSAATFWVSGASGDGHPHPRPVWGVWSVDGDRCVWLTLGSPRLRRAIADDPRVTVHLDSGVEVVIVEGRAAPVADPPLVAAFVAAYDRKYDWQYDVEQYGPPLRVRPSTILAWRSGGFAGRDGFVAGTKWTGV